LFARDRCDGRETVQEIGDFVAHHSERTKGITTRGAREWFTISQFIPFLAGIGKLHGSHLPSNFPAFLRATYKRIDAKGFKENTRIRYADGYRLLESAVKKFTKNADDTLSISADHTAAEIELIKHLSSVLVSKPAFDIERLFSDIRDTLKSHGLLKKEEMKSFAGLRPAIGLFAVSLMHNCTIQIDDNSSSQLKAHAPAGGLIEVYAYGSAAIHSPPQYPEPKTLSFASPIFVTGLASDDYCDPGLLAEPHPWEFDIEVNQNMKLAKLG